MRKQWMVPVLALVLLLAGTAGALVVMEVGASTSGDRQPPITSADDIDAGECSLVHNIDACSQGELEGAGGDGQSVAGVCVEGVPDCVDTVVNGDGEGLGRCVEDATAPECVAEEPPDGPVVGRTGTYEVTVAFDDSVTQADLDVTEEVVRAIDPDADYLIQESFPPVGRAFINSDDPDACAVLEEELLNVSSVTDVTCAEAQAGGGGDPDEPVSYP